MYTILLNETNELITSARERIMQRSKLVDNLHFLIDPIYKGINMEDFTVMMEYLLPISREYHSEILVKSDALYKGRLEYKLPLDTNITKEHGDVELQLTLVKVELDADGKSTQYVRKTSPTILTILPISAWSDIIADSALSAIDQRLIQVDAMLNAANEMNQYLYETKADNIVFDKEANELWLTANGTQIGNKIKLNSVSVSGGIQAIEITQDNELVVIYADGSKDIVGKINMSESGIYIPNVTNDGMLIYTLSDMPGDEVLSFDINPFNNWNTLGGPEKTSTYVWREL